MTQIGVKVPQQRRTPYTSVTLDIALRDAIQRDSLALSAEVGRRLTFSATVRALHTVAMRHRDEIIELLNSTDEEDSSS